MSFVDAILDRSSDRVHVVERNENGEREYRDYPAEYTFYYDDPKGKHLTIHRTPVTRVSTHSAKVFKKEIKAHNNKKLWEHDCNPIFRCLETNYSGKHSPQLHTCFFDIESDFDSSKGGYAPVDDPFNKITAVTLYLDWLDQLITLAVPPKTLSFEEAVTIADKFENTFIFKTEAEMLDTFLNLIDDADVLSGWNSEGYDIPYTVGRIIRVLSKDDLRRLCLWGQMPKQREYSKFGATNITYDLVGRIHLDYLQLYRKYTYEERHSYSLNAIGEYELNETKVDYEGSLDQLYNQDFKKFIEYNRQDVALLAKLDKKLRFLDLTNELAHDIPVLLQTTMGVVALTDQAIINEAHKNGLIAPSRKEKLVDLGNVSYEEFDAFSDSEEEIEFKEGQAAGAYVATPKTGMHRDIGAIDINSLYPSTIRALNMGPETIIGQLRPIMTENHLKTKMAKGASFSAAWDGLFATLEYTAVLNLDKHIEITVDWENGTSEVYTADQVWDIIFNSNKPWMLSANGTIFSYEREGIIPSILRRWYSERKELQAKKKAATDPKEVAFWDKKQHVKKIQLNSLYGALLNAGSRFNDHRIGQSTTLTGRTIAKHMDSFTNEFLTGKYQYDGETIIYGDTDSVYFSAWPVIQKEVEAGTMEWNRDICVNLYNTIADELNKSFPGMMKKACNCPEENGAIIKGGRELVASTGLFIKKKRYAVMIYDMEGTRLDLLDEEEAKKKKSIYGVGKVKAMGLDLKRSDTPKIVQDFLSDILRDALVGVPKQDIIETVKEFKRMFQDLPSWEKGTPKRVNNLTKFTDLEQRKGKTNMPGHVRAAMNWNNLRRMNGDTHSLQIVDGMKVIVCKLKNNPLGLTSCAYPIDVLHIPQWFKDLPFDSTLMETTIVDQKVENLLGVLKWDIASLTQINSTFDSLFSFED